MEIDTIDAMCVPITRYANSTDPSKVDLHSSHQEQYDFSPYTEEEDDDRSTSGESAQSNEEEARGDDRETPISPPDSRGHSRQSLRRPIEDNEKTQSSAASSRTDFTSAMGAAPSYLPPAPSPYTRTPQPSPPVCDDDNELFIYRHFKGPAPQPLVEEGSEELPPYTANIELSNVFLRKTELHNLNSRHFDRSWKRILLTLRGTKLEVHAAARPFYTQFPSRPDLPETVKKGSLIKTYSMQHAEVGVAKDYLKRKNVIRLRVEAEQFLLSCTEVETMIQWVEKLRWSAAFALDLDEREEIKETTLPQNLRRRRARATQSGTSDNAPAEDDGGNAGEERLRQPAAERPPSFENIAEDVAPDFDSRSNNGDTTAFNSVDSTPMPSRSPTPAPPALNSNYHTRASSNTNILYRSTPRPVIGRPHTSAGGRDGLAGYPSTLSQSITNLAAPPPPAAAASANHSSLSLISSRKNKKKNQKPPPAEEEPKWDPGSRYSYNHDISYARKCLPNLLGDARRKSYFVFYEGQRMMIQMGEKHGRDGKREALMIKVDDFIMGEEQGPPPPAYSAMIRRNEGLL